MIELSGDKDLASAIELERLGNFQGALQVYSTLLKKNPSNVQFAINVAANQGRMGDHASALKILKKLLKKNPVNLDVLNNLTEAYLNLGEIFSAIELATRSIKINPQNSSGYEKLSVAFKRIDKPIEALKFIDLALGIDQDNQEFLLKKGNLLLEIEDYSNAESFFKSILETTTNHVLAKVFLARLYITLHQYDLALNILDECIEIGEHTEEIYFLKGNTLRSLSGPAEALETYNKALSFVSSYRSLNNKACVLFDMRRYDEALKALDVEIPPQEDFFEFTLTKADLELKLQRYKQGWFFYEKRLEKPYYKQEEKKIEKPKWDGIRDIHNKVLVIRSEIGFGDSIQFLRFIPLVASLTHAKIIFEVQPALVKLIQESLDDNITVISNELNLEDINFDYYCWTMSLPFLLSHSGYSSLSENFPYLKIPDLKASYWSKQLKREKKLLMGINWSGQAGRDIDFIISRNRSIPLIELEHLFKLPFEFHSLQKIYNNQEDYGLMKRLSIEDHSDSLLDFSDTAALIDALDIIVTNDTSIAHLAGALNKKTLLILPFSSDYRWGLDGSETPWYPSIIIFRQQKINEWSVPIQEAINTLLT